MSSCIYLPQTINSLLVCSDLFDLVEQLHKVNLTLGTFDMDSLYVRNIDGSNNIVWPWIQAHWDFLILSNKSFCTSNKLRSYPDDRDDYRNWEFVINRYKHFNELPGEVKVGQS
uniref:Uncharacterized protein n=1 Tax=Oryza punctata TaxID=4537 RepID=A0A0E0KZ36_ORYPU